MSAPPDSKVGATRGGIPCCPCGPDCRHGCARSDHGVLSPCQHIPPAARKEPRPAAKGACAWLAALARCTGVASCSASRHPHAPQTPRHRTTAALITTARQCVLLGYARRRPPPRLPGPSSRCRVARTPGLAWAALAGHTRFTTSHSRSPCGVGQCQPRPERMCLRASSRGRPGGPGPLCQPDLDSLGPESPVIT